MQCTISGVREFVRNRLDDRMLQTMQEQIEGVSSSFTWKKAASSENNDECGMALMGIPGYLEAHRCPLQFPGP